LSLEQDRKLVVYKQHFWEFYEAQTPEVKEKIDYVLQIVIKLNRVPKKFFKHLTDGIYEIRIERDGNIWRIFCFLDGKKVILLHGFQKKSRKVPNKELIKAHLSCS